MIEVFTFHLREGVDAAAFRPLDERLQTDFFYRQPGLVRRTTARSDDGTWLCVVHWETAAHADAAASRISGADEYRAFQALVDPSAIERRRYLTL